MKKWTILVVLALCVTLLAGCGDATAQVKKTETPAYITAEQAIAIAAEYFGIAPGTVDEQTGYVMSYRMLETATEDNPVYKVALQWQVTIDGQPSHQSVLDYVYVNGVDGQVSTEDAG